MNYVVGFSFSNDGNDVVLIKKLRPEWQRERYNGVGGKVEPKETYATAMVREFHEETGVETKTKDWTYRANLGLSDGTIAVYTTFKQSIYDAAKTTEEEEIHKMPTAGVGFARVVPNLKWLIPFLLDVTVNRNVQYIDLTLEELDGN